MSEIVHIENFARGFAADYINPAPGECAQSKLFDLLSFPRRLQPIPSIQTDAVTAITSPDSLLGSMILMENGMMAGLGQDTDTPGNAELYFRETPLISGSWARGATRQQAGTTFSDFHYNFLVHFPENSGSVKNLYWAANGLLAASDPDGSGSAPTTQALTFSYIGKGIVHPKAATLYFPYVSTTAHYIGQVGKHASGLFNSYNATAFLLPFSKYTPCVAWYGDFLAIPLSAGTNTATLPAYVGLWDRDTTNTLLYDLIPWGDGRIEILNNLNGILVGISEASGGSTANLQGMDKLVFRGYAGGAEPVILKEFAFPRIDATVPSVAVSSRVNFVQNDRLYFSMDLTLTSSLSLKGLWSFGRNIFGEWTLTLERVSPDSTTVLAAALSSDFIAMVYNDEGYIADSVNSSNFTTLFGNTSSYETGINPQMPTADRPKRKKLEGVYATFRPLPLVGGGSSGEVVLQYRVDSERDDAWTSIVTETTESENVREKVIASDGTKFKEGIDYEFRITSRYGAAITSFGYKYDKVKSQIF